MCNEKPGANCAPGVYSNVLFLLLTEQLEHLLLLGVREVFHLTRRFTSVLDDRVGLRGDFVLGIEGLLDLRLREGETLALDRVQCDDRLVVLEERYGHDVADVEHRRDAHGFIGSAGGEQAIVHALKREVEGLVPADDGVAGARDAHGTEGLLRERLATRRDGVAVARELLAVRLERGREITLDDERIHVLHRDERDLLEEGLLVAHDRDDPGGLAEDVVWRRVRGVPGRRIRAELTAHGLHRTVFGRATHRIVLGASDTLAGVDQHESDEGIILRITARDADAPVELVAELHEPQVARRLHAVMVVPIDETMDEVAPVDDLFLRLRHGADAIDPRGNRAVLLVLARTGFGISDDDADGLFAPEADGGSHDAVRVVRMPVLVHLEGDVTSVRPGNVLVDLAVQVVPEDRVRCVPNGELLAEGILGDEGRLTVRVLRRHPDVAGDDVVVETREVRCVVEGEDPPEFAADLLDGSVFEIDIEQRPEGFPVGILSERFLRDGVRRCRGDQADVLGVGEGHVFVEALLHRDVPDHVAVRFRIEHRTCADGHAEEADEDEDGDGNPRVGMEVEVFVFFEAEDEAEHRAGEDEEPGLREAEPDRGEGEVPAAEDEQEGEAASGDVPPRRLDLREADGDDRCDRGQDGEGEHVCSCVVPDIDPVC